MDVDIVSPATKIPIEVAREIQQDVEYIADSKFVTEPNRDEIEYLKSLGRDITVKLREITISDNPNQFLIGQTRNYLVRDYYSAFFLHGHLRREIGRKEITSEEIRRDRNLAFHLEE